MTDSPDKARREGLIERPKDKFARSRRHDAALLLPIAGALAMLPPTATFFAVPERLFGVPLVVLYIFVLWVGLIAAAFILSRALNGGGRGG